MKDLLRAFAPFTLAPIRSASGGGGQQPSGQVRIPQQRVRGPVTRYALFAPDEQGLQTAKQWYSTRYRSHVRRWGPHDALPEIPRVFYAHQTPNWACSSSISQRRTQPAVPPPISHRRISAKPVSAVLVSHVRGVC